MKIMVLEDEPLIALATEQILQDLGYEDVDVFFRLDDASAAASGKSYDTAILDVNVDRQRTSLELARKMRDDGVSIIFASGNSIDETELSEIAVDLIAKPFQQAQVEAALANL